MNRLVFSRFVVKFLVILSYYVVDFWVLGVYCFYDSCIDGNWGFSIVERCFFWGFVFYL